MTVVKKLLSLKPPPDLTLVYNQCNNISPEKTMTLKMLLTPNTVTMTKLKLKFPSNHKSLTLFHINACSLNRNFDDLETSTQVHK